MIFWKSLRRVLNILWMFSRIYSWSHLALDFCFLRGFWWLFQLPYFGWIYLDFLILHDFMWESYILLRICPFLLGYWIWCCIAFHSGFYIILCISVVFIVTSLISILSLFFSFLCESSQDLSLLFQRTSVGFSFPPQEFFLLSFCFLFHLIVF